MPLRKWGRGAAIEWILIEVLETAEEVDTKSGKCKKLISRKRSDNYEQSDEET